MTFLFDRVRTRSTSGGEVNDEPGYRFDVLFGSAEVQTRVVKIDDGWSYEGRSIHRNQDGGIVRVTPWVQNIVLRMPPPRRPWWRF